MAVFFIITKIRPSKDRTSLDFIESTAKNKENKIFLNHFYWAFFQGGGGQLLCPSLLSSKKYTLIPENAGGGGEGIHARVRLQLTDA